ncbi:ankyrin repeat domain 28-like protein [Camelus ferus]|nr:ankyrin repeat domain 28-like protein [Camelus ferus]
MRYTHVLCPHWYPGDLAGARVNAKDNMWLTPLHRAVASRSEEAVQVLIKHSADVNARDKNWQTPLHVAAANKAVKCAEVIIPLLSSVNVSDRGGRTALHHAALNGHVEMVNLLLAKGANINAFDKKDRRALHWAAYMGHLDVVALLVNHGAEVTCKDKKGYTPLHAAASNGQISVVKHLLNLGVEIDEINVYGNTALHLACYNGQDAVVNELTDYGANVNQPNNSGFTPLHFAAASTHGALCLELLVNNGADVNIQDQLMLCNCIAKVEDETGIGTRTPRKKKGVVFASLKWDRLCKLCTVETSDFCFGSLAVILGGDHQVSGQSEWLPVLRVIHHPTWQNELCPQLTACDSSQQSVVLKLFECQDSCPRMRVLSVYQVKAWVIQGQKYSIVSLFSNEHVLSAGFEIDTPDKFGRTCLHAAAAGGNVECIKLLQSSGADFHKKDKCGRTPLHYAAANCHFHCIETLVTTGASVNETDDWGRTALHYAAASDMDRKCLEFLLQNDADPSIRDKEGYNSIHYAAAYGHRQCLELGPVARQPEYPWQPVQAFSPRTGLEEPSPVVLFFLDSMETDLLVHGDNFQSLLERTNGGFEESDSVATKSPLHLAAYNGHHQALEVLLQSLVDLDIRDEKGRTALDLAAFKGHTECVEALINQGASIFVKDNVTRRTPLHASEIADNPEAVDVKDAKGQTPLMLAVAYGHIDAVSLLLEKEANVDAVDIMGCTALHRGIMTGHEECVQMLLEQEVSILCKDSRGRTPLHYAAARGHATWLSELLQMALSEEDCSFKDNQGYTPLHWACYNGNENCIEVLLEQKCFRKFVGNPFTPLHCAMTPLHAAAFADHVECLQLLLRHNAQVNAADNAGKTALMMAAENGQAGAVDILVNSAQADLTVKDKDLNTPLHLASSKGHEKCALLILDKIQDESLINAKNNALQTPLHVAARNGLKVVVEELLAKGACVLAVDENDVKEWHQIEEGLFLLMECSIVLAHGIEGFGDIGDSILGAFLAKCFTVDFLSRSSDKDFFQLIAFNEC